MEWKDYCLSKENELQKMFPNKNIKNPKKLSEKIQWLKIHDVSLLTSYCADKIKLRDYCKEKLGIDICIPILAIYDKPEQIEWDKLPNKFVIKCNHGSGYNIVVNNKDKLNKNDVNKTLNKWINEKYGLLTFELHYNLIKPKIFIEEFKDFNGKTLADYKIWCFNGEPKFFTINYDFGHGNINFYNMNGEFLDISRTDFPSNKNRKDDMPKSLNKMIEYAKILSKDFKLVRVDFYEIDNQPILGELTFTPSSGNLSFKNINTDKELGKLLELYV